MPIVNPSLEHMDSFEHAAPDAAAIVMLNLLRFRDVADYGDGSPPVSGKKAYARYSRGVLPLLLEVGGYPLWMGRARAGVIVPEGESWDEVLLVHYPSRHAFMRMVRSEAYQRVMVHRTAGLSDSRLIETTAARLPRFVLRVASTALRVKALVGFGRLG
ncbi:MAG: DUF1330 domain-containing protein [Polyangiales bacterium]